VARAPEPISPEQVGRLNDLANNVAGRDMSLIMRSVITAETTRYGEVYDLTRTRARILTVDEPNLEAQHPSRHGSRSS
jgi:hypothetical protein